MTNQELIEKLDELSMDDWAEVVGTSAHGRYKGMRQRNSNASMFYEISGVCTRLRKILKRARV